MSRIRLDQLALKIQFTQQLPEHGPFVVLCCRLAGLVDSHAQLCRIERHLLTGSARDFVTDSESALGVGQVAIPVGRCWRRRGAIADGRRASARFGRQRGHGQIQYDHG